MTRQSDCIFCTIVAGEAPAAFVHRDELVSAFLDINPINPGHLLVVPNAHVALTRELADPTAERLFAIARRLARALPASGLRAEGTNLLVSDGETAGQEVHHAHMHVLPRFRGDGFAFRHKPARKTAQHIEELDHHAGAIRAAVEAMTE